MLRSRGKKSLDLSGLQNAKQRKQGKDTLAYLSTRKVRDEYGNVYYGIDEDMRDRLQAKLMRAVLDYKID